MRRRAAGAILGAVCVMACRSVPPENTFDCRSNDDCPPGQLCGRDQLCRRAYEEQPESTPHADRASEADMNGAGSAARDGNTPAAHGGKSGGAGESSRAGSDAVGGNDAGAPAPDRDAGPPASNGAAGAQPSAGSGSVPPIGPGAAAAGRGADAGRGGGAPAAAQGGSGAGSGGSDGADAGSKPPDASADAGAGIADAASGTAGSDASLTSDGAAIPATLLPPQGKWFCTTVGLSCTCVDGRGENYDDCVVHPPCCFTDLDDGINCQCFPNESSRCVQSQSDPRQIAVAHCPP